MFINDQFCVSEAGDDVFESPVKKSIIKKPILLNPSLKGLKAKEDVSYASFVIVHSIHIYYEDIAYDFI